MAYIGLKSLAKILFFLAILIRNLKIRGKNWHNKRTEVLAFQIRGEILAMNLRENNEDLEQDFMKNEKIINASSIIFFLNFS